MEQWYALHTKPNAEYQVAQALEQRLIQTYLPEMELPKTRQGRQPFFPCYLFARIDFNRVGYSSVQWTPGLRRVVSFEGTPTPLPDKLIEVIRRKLGEMEAAGGRVVPSFKPGETVRITDGPFRDMVAIFEGPVTPAQRVRILLNILGHTSRMQVDPADLAKVAPEVEAPPLKRPRRTRGGGRKINVQDSGFRVQGSEFGVQGSG